MGSQDETMGASPDQNALICLKNALHSMELGYWSWPKNRAMQWDEQMCHLFNAPPGTEPKALPDFLGHIKAHYHEAILDAWDTTYRENLPFDQVLEVKNNSTAKDRKLRMVGRLCLLPDSNVQILTGLCYELTGAENLKPRQSTELNSSFDRFFNVTSDLLAELDFDGYFIRLNPAWSQVLGFAKKQPTGKALIDFVHPGDWANLRAWIQQINEGPDSAGDLETATGTMRSRIRVNTGAYKWFLWTWTADVETRRIIILARDTTETTEEEDRLTQNLELAQRSNTELESFASTASHDMREPLRMISSYLNLLQERYPETLDDRGRRYINYAKEGADRMRILIEDLLSYAKIGKETKPYEVVALDQVFTQALDNLSVAIKSTGAKITIEMKEVPIVWGDQTRLTRLFQNLLGNAIKFHAEGKAPHVKVRLSDGSTSNTQNQTIISIKDNGIGIDPDHKDLLFKLFQRLNTQDEYEGSGIGLAICKKIAEQHGGKIWFTSKQNEGSTFYVSLKNPDPHKL